MSIQLKLRKRFGQLAAVVLGSTVCVAAHAAETDISTVPLTLQTAGTARANLMFILDDSGSMDSDYMPDNTNNNNRCFGYFGWNKLFYNPNKVYVPPKDASGNALPNANWPTVYNDGYQPDNDDRTTLDNNANGPFNKNNERFWYTIPQAGKPAAPTSCTSGDYDRVTSLPSDQRQNYANWWSYYRTRMLAMRAGVANAFAAVAPEKLRVGFSTISYTGASDTSSKFLNIRDYDQASVTISGTAKSQRAWFYDRLFKSSTSGSTPLRPALEKAGRYYANKLSNQSDPIQYSCQRNYTILSTDGYWNTSDETNYRNPYTPQGVTSNVAIGDRDGTAARPYYDSSVVGNTLADVAMYYYETDLRTSGLSNCPGTKVNASDPTPDVCENNVRANGRDTASHQHMTTYTIGLGVNGTLTYRKDYETASSGSYHDILAGTANWPNPNPTSTSNTVTARIDDLWHAAVNGRGYYFSANDATDLADSLSDALDNISKTPGASAAASTSSLRPVTGDDKVFIGKYTPADWSGKLEAYTMNTVTGVLTNPNAPNWEAGAVLNARTTARKVVFFKSTASNKLENFTYDNLSTTQKAYFTAPCTSPYKLSQCTAMVAGNETAKINNMTGANLVSYLTGARTHEMSSTTAANQLFRTRGSPLGDFGSASPVYVKKPPFKYADAGYAAFVTAKSSGSTARRAVVYAAANDGMLHAFDATNGNELWAYVPSMVIENMARLADVNYTEEDNHRFYVDATPVIADVYDGSAWRTLLIGGLGAGGRGYYALDVTDPDAPVGLWEFTDTHLGLTYGLPIVGKLKNGTWVVALTSGYNNNVGGGDGNGRVYVLNAVTGAAMFTPLQTYVSGTTAAGSASTPNNLAKLNGWVDTDTDNTILRLYGGDWLGNLWRFDIDDNIAPAGRESMLLAKATAPNGSAQPITARPTLTEIGTGSNRSALVSFGTGRYLTKADLADTQVQSVYVVKDGLDTTQRGVLRNNSAMVKQTLDADTRKLSNPQTVNWATNVGWFVDLSLTSKERVNVDPLQQFTTLTVATNIPTATACSPGGTSWLYYFDLRDGTVLKVQSFGTITVGMSSVLLNTQNGGQGKPATLLTGGGGELTPVEDPLPTGAGGTTPRRTSWRELVK